MESDWDGVNVVSKLSNTGLLLEGYTCFHRSLCVCVRLLPSVCVCVFLSTRTGASVESDECVRFVLSLSAALFEPVCSSYCTNARDRWLSPSLSLLLVHPVDSGHLYFFLPRTVRHVCACMCACEVLRSSYGLIEMTFLLFKLNYPAPLFICSPDPLFPVQQLSLFLSGPKTCAHKSH